jgi:hypothetical protein
MILAPSSHRNSGLWAITTYFNPQRYRRRIENYRVFRDSLTVPLVAVELSFDGEFQLHEGDAEILVQLHGGDVMWQKERLLNIALQSVPKDCQAIAWVDCDVVFDSPEWDEHARRALHNCALIHLYREIYNVPPDATLSQSRSPDIPPTSRSIIYKMTTGEFTLADLPGPYQVKFGATCGQAWASPRRVLEKHGFYDVCILGSGDRAFLCAAWGEFQAAADYMRMNPRRAEHYLSWARPYFATVCGEVGYIPGRLFHLWHGEFENRKYAARHDLLEAFEFDPERDIAIDSSGCWRWSSDKPEMHARVRHYFAERDEDGNGEVIAPNSCAGTPAASHRQK